VRFHSERRASEMNAVHRTRRLMCPTSPFASGSQSFTLKHHIKGGTIWLEPSSDGMLNPRLDPRS
jgi:hypothetical protein